MSEYMPDFCLKKMSEIVRIYYMSVGEGSSKKKYIEILDMKMHHCKNVRYDNAKLILYV